MYKRSHLNFGAEINPRNNACLKRIESVTNAVECYDYTAEVIFAEYYRKENCMYWFMHSLRVY